MSRILVALTLVVLLGSISSAMAQEWVPAGTTVVAPTAPLPVQSWAVPTTAYYAPAPVVAAPAVSYYAPAPVYYYPQPAVVAYPYVWRAPVVYGGGYTVRTRYYPYSVRTVVRAW